MSNRGAEQQTADASSPERPPVELPSISLPKGGGAIRGMDEKLIVGQATGTATVSVPVFTSPARGGSGPALGLGYDSSAGNGPFGLGWRLPTPAISRKTSSGVPRYDDEADSDTFALEGAEDLVPLLAAAGSEWAEDSFDAPGPGGVERVRRYRPRIEGGFARIERRSSRADGEVRWRTVSAGNVTSVFGATAASRIADPEDPSRVFSWLLDHSFDDRGNVVAYEYKAENREEVPALASEARRGSPANLYLKRIRYGNRTPYRVGDAALPVDWCFEVVLDYGEHDAELPTPAEVAPWPCRPDPFSTYRSGFEVRTYRLCRRILMFHRFPELGEEPTLVRSTDLTYGHDETPPDPALPRHSLLVAAGQTGWVRRGDGYETAELPPLELEYAPLRVDDTQRLAPAESVENLPGSLSATRQRLVDLESEGLPGVLTETREAWYYKRNVSAWDPAGGSAAARFEPLTEVARKPAGTPTQLVDIDGDGRLEAVSLAPQLAGFFEPDGEGWGPFAPFASAASIAWTSPNLRLVDLDGDGRPDVLISEDEAFAWHRWDGDGFAPADREPRPPNEDRGPALVLSAQDDTIFLADMSGDGLADLVRVRNGEVCYWPSCGHGRFGAKVEMDGAPVFDAAERFDAGRVRLADVDGSGPADLIYLGERTRLWFNQSGSSWSLGREVAGVPVTDGTAEVDALDFLGTGTACLVWSSGLEADAPEPLRYVDLTAGIKPHLLTAVRNNLGAERRLTYAPSTKFYVEDAARGQPWITRLPFPVQVVERVETTETVSGTRLVSTYSYHHGHYDGIEREFRGFARVEQTDAETVPAESGSGSFTATPPVAGDEYALPPVRTRTWFHTGYFDGREELVARLAREFYAGDPEAPRLGRGALPAEADAEELREACRALRGQVLRQEVYAEDASPAAVHPYSVSDHRYGVRRLQPRTATAPGSFHTWEQEQVSCHYERDPSDPRVGHSMTLAVDEFGAVTRSASAAYGRRAGGLPEQRRTLVTYEETDLVNVAGEADWYRLGLPVEHRSYELTAIEPDPSTGIFTPEALASAASAAAEIPKEEEPTPGTPQRRLLSRRRTIYLRDDLSGPLAPGAVESLALVDRTYGLRYTPGMLDPSLAARAGGPAALAALLEGPGGFVDLDGDGSWWAPSGRAFYSPDPDAPDPGFAREHFFLPQGRRDPWANLSRVAYDGDDLLVAATVDALGNATSAQNNYRVLGPWLTTDANGNRGGVRYDALGMVVAAAAMGKRLDDGGDEGDHLDTTTAEPAPEDDPTIRTSYDLDAFRAWAADPSHDPGHPAPVWSRTRARVRHRDPESPWTDTYAYGDGLGRAILVKTLAEPGPAPRRDAEGELVRDGQGRLVIAEAAERWVGSGRAVHDNKGNVVKGYEPFFDSGPGFTTEADLVELGVTAINRYDPLGRAIRVDNPNGSFRTVSFGPWEQVNADENDTCAASAWYAARAGGALGPVEEDAATKAAAHAGTPSTAHFDPLGRIVRTEQDLGPRRLPTAVEVDVEGHARALTDALGRLALSQDYDVAGAELRQASADGGERRLLRDAGGLPLLGTDSREHTVTHLYDELRRPTDLRVQTGTAPPRVAERIVYGEGLAGAAEANLVGAVHSRYDEAGVTTTERRDFDGNVVSASYQPIADDGPEVDWASPPVLDPETFTTANGYDALGRPTAATAPDGTVSTSTYNERGLLTRVSVDVHGGGKPRDVLAAVSYDEHGRRALVRYGNEVSVRFSYDPETTRLVRVLATRPGSADALQDLTYAYDPVGNVTHVTDAAAATIVFAGQVVGPDRDYAYDPLYRLVRASGREHLAASGAPQPGFDDGPRRVAPLPADTQAMRNYTQVYAHDDVGNLESVAHSAAGGSWTRGYAYDEPHLPPRNNRLTATTIGSVTERCEYDPHGNVISMPQLSLIEWDWKDRLSATATRVVGTGSPEKTRYRYDSSGVRARKTVNTASGRRTSQRLYLGPYELYREYDASGAVTLERQSLHVSDGAGRACLLETTTADASGSGPLGTLARYQLGDRLGSSVMELDGDAAVITFEEYHPYGSTAFLAGRSAAETSLKRYRFNGRERDRETGFNYHGARYYAPWLGRWTSPDPAGFVDGPARYTFARSNPACLGDPSGRQGGGDPTIAPTVPVLTLTFDTPPVRQGTTSTQLWLFQQPSFGQDVRATRSGRGIGEGVRLDMTAMARWWGYGGSVDAGHPSDKPFWSLRAGDVVPVMPQPSGDNRSQGATTDRAAAAAARADGQFARVDGVDLTAPTDAPRQRQPTTAPIYSTPAFRAMKDRLLALPDATATPSATSTTGAATTTGTTTAAPSGTTGTTGTATTSAARQPVQLELDFNGSRSTATATGSAGAPTQTGTPVEGEPGSGGSGQGTSSRTGTTGGGSTGVRPEVGPGSGLRVGGGSNPIIGPNAPGIASAGRAAAQANPVIPGADVVEQFFNDMANSASLRGSTVMAGVYEVAAAGTALVATSAASGAIAGNLAEAGAKAMGASDEEAKAQGALAAIFAGALVGGAVAGPTIIGEPVGIVVGALVGLTAYLLTR
ncbi:MAG TPA: SpvB/TcaC N-terminal domain-containing protein [Solirubrobacterales bacterium]|nr:SpvB/TcaC N-terminal domain-containing protein [Solirubrobacterales bacterium]